MAMRFRRSVKLGPGVRLNIGKHSAGISFGGRGYRYSVNSSGRTTRTLGIPGSGVSWVRTSKIGAGQSARTPAAPAATSQLQVLEKSVPKPGLLAPGWEASYRKGVIAVAMRDYVRAIELFGHSSKNDTKNLSDDLFLAFALSSNGASHEQVIPLLEKVVASPIELPDRLQTKYCSALKITLTTEVVPGIEVQLPLDGVGAAFLLAEAYQSIGKLDEATDVVEGLGEAGMDLDLTALSLAELYSAKTDWQSVIDISEGATNTDDMTGTLLVYRAAAFRELGLYEASLGAIQEAAKSRSRSAELLLAAHYQRARTLEAQGKLKMAAREYGKVVGLRSTYADAQSRLEAIAITG